MAFQMGNLTVVSIIVDLTASIPLITIVVVVIVIIIFNAVWMWLSWVSSLSQSVELISCRPQALI